jgi:GNAT superfamily N-acetyltransferase
MTGGVALVRPMRDDDIEAVSAVRVNGWKAAYQGLVPAGYLDQLTVAEDARKRRGYFAQADGSVENLVAESGGEVVGWAALGPSSDDDRRDGDAELLAIYVRPDLIGTGIGKALMERVLIRCREHGFHRLALWVIEGNIRARAFYEAWGFVPDGRTVYWEVCGEAVPELCYRRELSLRDTINNPL